MEQIVIASIVDPINPRLRQQVTLNVQGLKALADLINEQLGHKALLTTIATQQTRIAELEAGNAVHKN